MTTIRTQRASRIIAAPIAQAQVIQARPGQFFSIDVETELAQADHEAWTAVCTILIMIVSVGLLLGLGGVLLSL
jgi:hypothetical protein